MIKWYGLGLLWSLVSFADASFKASVDTTQVRLGEPITLTLTFFGQTREEPDLSELERDFSVTSRQISQESTMIQGTFQAKTRYIMQIFPKSADKTITIPAIKLQNNRTEPIVITQSEQHHNQTDGLSLTVTTDRPSVYVHGELIVRMVLRSSSPLRAGSLSELTIPGAIIEPLQSNDQEEIIDQGIRSFVVSKVFAVYPSTPGTLEIPAIIFNGVINQEVRRRGWPDFFNPGQRVQARSMPLTVNVLDVPKEYPQGKPFLPLKNLVITETVSPQKDQLDVHEAYTRRFEIKAKGTLASYLPTIMKPDVANVSIYVEEGERQQKNPADGIEASRFISHVYMPQVPGKIAVPQEEIYWWDVDNDKLEVTPVRPFDIEVIGNAQAQPVPPKQEPHEQPIAESSTAQEQNENNDHSWVFLAIACVLMMFVVVGVWLKLGSGRPRGNENYDEFDALTQTIQTACHNRDVHAVLTGLLALKAWYERHPEVFLGFNEELTGARETLESLIFKQRTKEVPLKLLESIANNISKTQEKPKKSTVLAPLYPV